MHYGSMIRTEVRKYESTFVLSYVVLIIKYESTKVRKYFRKYFRTLYESTRTTTFENRILSYESTKVQLRKYFRK